MIRRATPDDLDRVDLLIKAHPTALMDKGAAQLREMFDAAVAAAKKALGV